MNIGEKYLAQCVLQQTSFGHTALILPHALYTRMKVVQQPNYPFSYYYSDQFLQQNRKYCTEYYQLSANPFVLVEAITDT